jgi:hypothetical protein
MKPLTIKLPERIYDVLRRVAEATNIQAEDIATDILVDALLSEAPKGGRKEENPDQEKPITIEQGEPRVSGYKSHSINWLDSNDGKVLESDSVSSSCRDTFSNG